MENLINTLSPPIFFHKAVFRAIFIILAPRKLLIIMTAEKRTSDLESTSKNTLRSGEKLCVGYFFPFFAYNLKKQLWYSILFQNLKEHTHPHPKTLVSNGSLKIENFRVIFRVFPYNSENTAKERISDSNRA